jgi:hypothetical protein
MGEAQRRHSLRFLSGKDQGREYVLADPSETVMGRASDVELILVEGMVSRRHAMLRLDGGILTIEDLGSMNGTFVNGERVRIRKLAEGDRVLVGTTIMKVEFSKAPLGTKPPPPPKSSLGDVETSRDLMSGQLQEVGVPELIEMFGAARQALVLEIETRDDRLDVFISDGVVIDCESRKLGKAPAQKCIHRALGQARGRFAVLPYREPPDARLEVAIPELLVDGLFKLDELAVFRQRLPEPGEKISLNRPLRPRLRALEPADLDLLQLAHNHGEIDAIIDTSPEVDAEVARRLLALFDGGYLRRG